VNLEPTDEQVALRDTVRRFLADRAPVADHVRPRLDDPEGATGPVFDGLVELGTTGVLVPEEHGGAGLTMVEAGIVAEELGRALHSGPWTSTAVAATRALTRLVAGASGSGDAPVDADATRNGAAAVAGNGDVAEDVVAELLAGIADGSVVATVALAEDLGSPAAAPAPATTGRADPATTATWHGGQVTLTGEKVGVTDAVAATTLLVLATDGDGDGPALFAVAALSPGVEVTPQSGVDLTRRQGRVRFDGAPATRLGAAGPGLVQAVVDDLLVTWAADALGAAQAVVDLAVEHARVRTQFGRPIGAFQAVQHLCVDMVETVELARGGVLHALWAADAPDPTGTGERHLAAVRAKAFSGRLATVGDTAIQVLGGIGFTWEHDAHLHLRRLLGWSAFLGRPAPYLRELGAHLTASTPPTLRSTGWTPTTQPPPATKAGA
jgi:alkylation response protein AidB-like acyl-CoA dehydrogenase